MFFCFFVLVISSYRSQNRSCWREQMNEIMDKVLQIQRIRISRVINYIQDILTMATGIFDQKMFRPANQMYYFQLVPKLLTIRNPTLLKDTQSSSSEFRLKIIKGVQLCDEMKKSIGVKAVNGRAGFDKAQLNFNLPSYNPNRNIQFTLVLLRWEQGSEEQEVGRYAIISNTYVNELKTNKSRHYQEQVSLGDNFSLKFDMFIDSSRFGLEKLIKQMNQEKKEQKRQNILVEFTKKDIANDPTLNQAKSQMLSESSKVEVITAEGRFMSPSRKIVRKQSETRKILRRQSSPTRSQDQTSSKKGLKFLSRNTPREQSTLEKTQSLAEEEARKLTEKIREQQQKRQISIKQKQLEDIQRKIIEDKKRREQQQSKKAEEARKAQQRRIEAQRVKQLQIKKAEEARKAQEPRIEAQRIKQLQAKKAQQEKAAEQKRQEMQRKRQQLQKQKEAQQKKIQQAAKKAEEARKLAQQQRIEAQKRRQQERARRIEQQKIENAKRMAEQQEIQRRFQEEEEKRRIQLEQIKKRQSAEAVKTKESKNIRNERKQTTKKEQDTKVVKRKQKVQSSNDKSGKPTNPANSQQEQQNLRDSIMVRVKTESSHELEKYVFEAKPIVDSKKWSQPLNIKKTGSQLFDKKGNKIREEKVEKKGKEENDTKTKIFLFVFIIISLFLLYAAITPTRRRR